MMLVYLLLLTDDKTSAVANDYICLLGGDDENNGQVYKISATLQQKNECTSCSCRQIPVECLWGPDSYGQFTHQTNVLKSVADQCDRNSCICSSHGADFLKLAEERVSEAHHKIEKARTEAKKQQDLFLGITTDIPPKDDDDQIKNEESSDLVDLISKAQNEADG